MTSKGRGAAAGISVAVGVVALVVITIAGTLVVAGQVSPADDGPKPAVKLTSDGSLVIDLEAPYDDGTGRERAVLDGVLLPGPRMCLGRTVQRILNEDRWTFRVKPENEPTQTATPTPQSDPSDPGQDDEAPATEPEQSDERQVLVVDAYDADGRALSVHLARTGLAAVRDGAANPALRTARARAITRGAGLFSPRHSCSLAAARKAALTKKAEAVRRSVFKTSAAAQTALGSTQDALTAARQVSAQARDRNDLRALAYPPADRRQLRTEAAELVAELERWKSGLEGVIATLQAREAVPVPAQPDPYTPSLPDPPSNSGGLDGYTGPRCYAPGGHTWRPC